MDLEIVESMAQGEITVQDIPMMQVQFPPQTDPESEMCAAAAAAGFDTPLRQNPSPAPGGSVPDNGESTTTGLADVRGMWEALMGAMNGMNAKMDTNAQQMEGLNNKSDRRTTMRSDFSDILYNLYDK